MFIWVTPEMGKASITGIAEARYRPDMRRLGHAFGTDGMVR